MTGRSTRGTSEFVFDDVGQTSARCRPCDDSSEGSKPRLTTQPKVCVSGALRDDDVNRAEESTWRRGVADLPDGKTDCLGQGCYVARAEMVEVTGDIEVIPVPPEEDRSKAPRIRKEELHNTVGPNRITEFYEELGGILDVLERMPASGDVEEGGWVLDVGCVADDHLESAGSSNCCGVLRYLDPDTPPPLASSLNKRVANTAANVQQVAFALPGLRPGRVVQANAEVRVRIRQVKELEARRSDPQAADRARANRVKPWDIVQPALSTTNQLCRRDAAAWAERVLESRANHSDFTASRHALPATVSE
jgi:hypothetical protein